MVWKYLGCAVPWKGKPQTCDDMVEPIAKQQKQLWALQEQKFFVQYDEESFSGNYLIESQLQRHVCYPKRPSVAVN